VAWNHNERCFLPDFSLAIHNGTPADIVSYWECS
jgi:hypothetical protein